MPKHHIDLVPGRSLPDDLKDWLARYFEPKQLQKLERLGGRVTFSFVAPYVERNAAGSEVAIDEQFLETIRAQRSDKAALEQSLKPLKEKQLRELCRMVGQPVRSSASKGELKAELIRNLQAEDFWQRISASSANAC
ncbi:MAG TPA: hypothetical protein VGM18_03870 [Candidatus Sulfotelmatobacter sp.]|jgi:hypothetical protein